MLDGDIKIQNLPKRKYKAEFRVIKKNIQIIEIDSIVFVLSEKGIFFYRFVSSFPWER